MTQTTKPKRALLAYCALAERLNKPGVGAIQALTPFLAEVCRPFAGEMFDAAKFSDAVNTFYDIKIPRLAALGLAEQLAKEGLLTADSGNGNYTVYRYPKAQDLPAADVVSPVTEAEIASVLISFIDCCRTDKRLISIEDAYLEAAFFDRLLKIDSMRLLSRREASIATKKGADTLILKKATSSDDPVESSELHIDFLVSQFLLDLRDNKPASFELVSNIAFASMAAEAIACFREPLNASTSLQHLTLYLDAPLLLDMLGVNAEYTDYGKELLDAIMSNSVQ